MLKKIGLVFFLCGLYSVAKADLNGLLKQLPFSQQEKQQILQGELVTTQVKESEDHELAVLLAFVVKATPNELKQHFIKGTWIDLPEPILMHQKLTTASTIENFSKLRFSAKESNEIDSYLSAQAGNNLNLSANEIKQFQSLKTSEKKTAEVQKVVEEQLHKMLLNRFHAYKNGGVKAILPYQREQGKQFSLGEYFQHVTRFDSILQQYFPVFYRALKNYPVNKPAQMEESFFALKLDVQDHPTFALMHRMLLEENDAFVVALRQYYVTQTYNGEQDLGLFIPIKQGMLVIGLFRTSSDAVAGFGSSVKHSVGRRLLAHNLTQYYEKIQQLIKSK